MAHPAPSSSQPAQIPALDNPHTKTGDNAPKEKKGKTVNTGVFPLEVRFLLITSFCLIN